MLSLEPVWPSGRHHSFPFPNLSSMALPQQTKDQLTLDTSPVQENQPCNSAAQYMVFCVKSVLFKGLIWDH